MNAISKIEELEQLSLAALNEYQWVELQKALQYLEQRSPFYQRLFAENGIDIGSLSGPEDLKKIPTTSKADLASHPDDFLCITKNEVADFTTTSGTMGNPVTVCLSKNDIDRLAYNEAISMIKAGCTEDDIFQLATTMDKRFMAGLAYNEGVRKLGAGMIRVGASAPSLHWDSIERFNPTVIIAIPSFILMLMDYAKKNGIDHRKSALRKVIAIGQPVRDKNLELNMIGQRIRDEWGLEVYSTYASTEMGAAFTECTAGKGGHLNPDLIYLEVLNEDGEQVGNGEVGEVVITSLGVEAMPLLRYKTGDLVTYYTDRCECGRCTPRVGPVLGRKQQLIKYKGTTVHPSSIIPLLDANKSFRLYLIELITDELGLDGINIVFAEEEVTSEQASDIIQEIGDHIKVKPTYQLVPANQLSRLVLDPSSRKPLKILDNRKV